MTQYKTWTFVVCCCLLLFLSGCARNYVLKYQDTDLSSSFIEPLPLKIGVYYPDEFRTYSYTFPRNYGHVFHIGESSVALFNKLLNKMFENVVEVEGIKSTGVLQEDLDAIIEFSVRLASFSFGRRPTKDELMISYRSDLYTPSGKLLTSWVTDASGTVLRRGLVWNRARLAMENAFISAEKNFVVNSRIELARHPGLFLRE